MPACLPRARRQPLSSAMRHSICHTGLVVAAACEATSTRNTPVPTKASLRGDDIPDATRAGRLFVGVHDRGLAAASLRASDAKPTIVFGVYRHLSTFEACGDRRSHLRQVVFSTISPISTAIAREMSAPRIVVQNVLNTSPTATHPNNFVDRSAGPCSRNHCRSTVADSRRTYA